jgi:tRNA nucleotidyltransferase (CCA-adding enzyme)
MELTDKDGNPIRPKLVTLEEIVAKKTWQQEDIDLLIQYQDSLDDETLERLGIVEVAPKTAEEVAKETSELKKKKVAEKQK